MADSTKRISSADRKLLLGWLEGSLSDSETQEVLRRLESEADFGSEYERLRRLDVLLTTSAPDGFQPFFSSRVTQRLFDPSSSLTTVSDAIRLLFPRLALACIVILVALGTLNMISYGQPILEGPLLDALLSLPRSSLENALYLAIEY